MIANSAEQAHRNILIGSPTSFCTGVERAIETVRELLNQYGAPVYVRKVHAKARRFARAGHTVLLIGHADHEETEGTAGEAPDRTVIIENEQDAAAVQVPDPDRVAYLTQTTLTPQDTAGIVAVLRDRFTVLVDGGHDDDICFATRNRQSAARAVATKADLVLVVGSANSSNAQRLVDVVSGMGVPSWLIDDALEIDPRWLDGVRSVGLLAGASTPRRLLDDVIAALQDCGGADVAEINVADESGIVFALPMAQLQAAGAPLFSDAKEKES